MPGQLSDGVSQCDPYVFGSVAFRNLEKHQVSGLAFDQGSDSRLSCSDDEVAFPVTGNGTVLGLEEDHSAPARAFMKAVNKQGAFDNLSDTRNGLDGILSASFSDVAIDVVGSLALFTARNPIHT
jgi:hypothetical protein